MNRHMNRHLTRLLLALYPPAWRYQYGAEVVRLTEELIAAGEITPAQGALNMAVSAAAERGRALAESRRAALAMAVAALVAVAGSLYVAGHTRLLHPPAAASAAPAPAAQASLARVLCWFARPVAGGPKAAGWVPAGASLTVDLPAGTKLTARSRLQAPVTFAPPGQRVGHACLTMPVVCRAGRGRTVTVSPGLTVWQVTVQPGRCVLAIPDKAPHSGP